MEGRLSKDKGTVIRSEGNFSLGMAIKQWKKNIVGLGAFYSAASYYETVFINNAGVKLTFDY
ncbi:MAG: hypothetical protein GC181_13520 [Bacteroidetes bacterium]|nr:hypothetical protein [Bacteroidota bacterium]